jgi:phosphatidylserine decarboxylase
LYLPEGCVPLVAVGQRMVGGETVIAELGKE